MNSYWSVLGRKGVPDQTRAWQWIGLTLRKPQNRFTLEELDWNPQGHRKQGDHCKTLTKRTRMNEL